MTPSSTYNRTRTSPLILLLIGLLAVAFGVVFSPVWQNLFRTWSASDDYSHGILILPLSLYILWRKREEMSKVPVRPSWTGFYLVLASLVLYLLASFAEIVTLAPLAMILFLGGSVAFLFGFRVFKVCLFPLLLLLFMVPVPAQIYAALTIPLQLFVTKVTVFFASLIGVPILREGNVLHLPQQTLQVVQACSGLRSVLSLLTLGAVLGYLSLKANPLRGILFMSAVPIAVAVNVVRVLVMVLAFYYYDFDLTEGPVHSAFGTAIFGLAIVLFLLARKGLSFCDK